jgi:hypothetical protein
MEYKQVEKLIGKIAWQNRQRVCMEFEDLFQELSLEYVKVKNSYTEQSAKFSTYLYKCLMYKIHEIQNSKYNRNSYTVELVDYSVFTNINYNDIYFKTNIEVNATAKKLFKMMERGVFNRPNSKTYKNKLSVSYIKKMLYEKYNWTKKDINKAFKDLKNVYELSYAI